MKLSKIYIAEILPNVAWLTEFSIKRKLNYCHEFPGIIGTGETQNILFIIKFRRVLSIYLCK